MKKSLFSLVLLAFTFQLKAADLIVEEFGTLPTYNTIASAVAASVNGDRIIIKNRAGLVPWIENITISKSLTFLSYDNNTQFVVQGNYTIDKATGREVNIIGMKNTSGNIQEGTGSSALRGTDVSVMDCWFINGFISLANAAYDLQIVGNRLDVGYVQFYYGNVIGNDITGNIYGIRNLVGIGTWQADTCFIVGNKVNVTNTNESAIYVSGSPQVYHIRNNYLQHKGYGINVASGNANAVANLIWNNTIINAQYTSSTFGIYLTPGTSSVWEIMNNVLDESSTGTSYGIYYAGSTGQSNVYYNHVDSSFDIEISTGWTFSGNNTTNTTFTINADGTLAVGNSAINGGNPAQPYYDLDLTVGDGGAYGGSYTLNNFFPLFTGAARVYFVKFPFNVRQGSTLSVKAFGYDR